MDKIMGALQRLGKALMGAVAVLPVAALMSGFGYFLTARGAETLGTVFLAAGGAVLDYLGWIFAVAIAYGLARDSNGAAALSGFVGYATVTKIIGEEAVADYKGVDLDSLDGAAAVEWTSQGWSAINDANVLIGITVGILAAWTYNRFSTTKLPDYLAFFSGRRLVPILTSLFSLAWAGILYVVWPLVYNGLFSFGQWIQGFGAIGAGIYGVVNRLLIPTGMHHALNSIFWFDVIGIDDIGKFQAGQATIDAAAQAKDAATCPGLWTGSACEVVGTIGQYQAGFFPVMMFGLPGAALAIYLRARKDRRKVVGSLMAAGALAAFLTGVTEPLEFVFMFSAPLLYVVHALLTGLSLFIAASFDWTAGFGFSAGLFDMLLSSQNPLANQWWMLIVMGLAYSVIYFGIFYVLIGVLNLKTPGREEEGESVDGNAPLGADAEIRDKVAVIVRGLGGARNITSIDYCTTRLRTTVTEPALVSEETIRSAGIAGLMRPSKTNVQAIIGPNVQFYFDELTRQLDKGGESSVDLASPTDGTLLRVEDVSDQAFATKVVGDGFAVVPGIAETVTFCSPGAGTVTQVFMTLHAFAVRDEEYGLDVLVHVGIDTVHLKGQGFTALVAKGEKVAKGQPVLRVEAAELRARGIDLTTPVVMTNKKQLSAIELSPLGTIATGQPAAHVLVAGAPTPQGT